VGKINISLDIRRFSKKFLRIDVNIFLNVLNTFYKRVTTFEAFLK